jgi:hypothetical protein
LIANYTTVSSIDEMPLSEMCSECYLKRLAAMQTNPYSIYDGYYKNNLELIYERCGESGPTDIPPPVSPRPDEDSAMCVSEKWYTVSQSRAPCEQVAYLNKISAVALYNLNPQINDCSNITRGTKLCLPLSCGTVIDYSQQDTCSGLEAKHGLQPGDIRRFNPWIYHDCSNLAGASEFFGGFLCAGPSNGEYSHVGPGSGGDTVTPHPGTGYTLFPIDPPQNSTVAEGTTMKCGRWHEGREGDSCVSICLSSDINIELFTAANPSLGTVYSDCTDRLVPGQWYCSGPTFDWQEINDEM